MAKIADRAEMVVRLPRDVKSWLQKRLRARLPARTRKSSAAFGPGWTPPAAQGRRRSDATVAKL